MRVLVVEDSARMSQALKKGLTEEAYAVDVAENGIEGLHKAKSGEYDIVLLDLNLPGMDGMALVRELRAERSDVPVIMITARDGVQDRIAGLDGGADDYLVKPFSFEELLARMRALLRRPGARSKPILRFQNIELDPAKGQVTRNGKALSLSAREFSLLQVFLSNPNQVMNREELLKAVWGNEYGTSNVVDVYVNYVRNRLEWDGGSRVIQTVRGQGYILSNLPLDRTD